MIVIFNEEENKQVETNEIPCNEALVWIPIHNTEDRLKDVQRDRELLPRWTR